MARKITRAISQVRTHAFINSHIVLHQIYIMSARRHVPWFMRTVLVKDGKLSEAHKMFNQMLALDDIFGKHRRTRYCEKPFNYRRRKSYEITKAIYDEDMARKIKFVLRNSREDPWT